MKTYWDRLHKLYTKEDWINRPTLFAQWVIKYFPPSGHILDIGGGQGQDAIYFSGKGYQYTLTDISKTGLDYARKKIPNNMKNRIKLVKHDVANPLPFNKEIFDIVYSHLSLHYFDKKTTKKIFSQIYKVLKPHGFIAIMLNSTKDPEYGQGKKLEQDFYQIGEITKRYFSPKSIKEFVQPYHTIMLDNRGETYKDRRIGVHNLIRFVGKK